MLWKGLGKAHEEHVHAALDGIDGVVGQNDDHVSLVAGKSRVVVVFLDHGLDLCTQSRGQADGLVEEAGDGGGGYSGQAGYFLNGHESVWIMVRSMLR